MPRILIADDHSVVRQGVKAILAEAFPKSVFGEAITAEEAMDFVRKQAWDLAILDISMPEKGGLAILGEIKIARPRLPVLFLSMHPEEQFARRALKAGAAGYVTKESVSDELVQAVRKVLAGGRYVSAQLAESLAFDIGRDAETPLHELLSDREFQVLRLIACGKTVSEIAESLHLSMKTVSTYRTRILEKTGMKNNAELIRYALQNRLVS